MLLGTDGGHCNTEVLQDIQTIQLSKLHRNKMFDKRKWLEPYMLVKLAWARDLF